LKAFETLLGKLWFLKTHDQIEEPSSLKTESMEFSCVIGSDEIYEYAQTFIPELIDEYIKKETTNILQYKLNLM